MRKDSGNSDGSDSIDREKLLKQKVIFCTECGVDLTNFCFSERAKNPEAVRKNLAQCKKIGKFNGEFCSKLFISDDYTMDDLWVDDEFDF
jgi:hypothetical protein